jgi:uncharacterized transporter YbjL
MTDTGRIGREEGSDNTLAVALGVVLGITLGAVVFAITRNPIWLGIGIPFGAAVGMVLGTQLQGRRP